MFTALNALWVAGVILKTGVSIALILLNKSYILFYFILFSQSGEIKLSKPYQSDLRGTSLEQQSSSLNSTQAHHHKLADFHATKKPSSPKQKHDFECDEGFDLALIAIFPNSERNSFSVISQENSVRKKKSEYEYVIKRTYFTHRVLNKLTKNGI